MKTEKVVITNNGESVSGIDDSKNINNTNKVQCKIIQQIIFTIERL